MKLIRTAKIRIDQPKELFEPTIQAYTNAYNFVCKIGYKPLDTNGVSLHNKTYEEIRKSLPSQLAISARMKATESLKSVKNRKKKGKKISCPQSKQCSIRLDKNSYSLWLESRKISILTINGRKKFQLNIPTYFEQYLTWKYTSADLFLNRSGQIFIHIVFEKEITDTIPNGKLIGIDRGIKNIATTSDGRFFGGGLIKQASKKYQEQRSQLQSKISQGSRSAQRHFSVIRRKERRFRADANHCISKQIVDKLQTGDTIVLEKLTGIRGGSTKFRKQQRTEINKWNFYQLEQFLTYKSMAKGIPVVYVDARYTSQRCSKCGHIERANRQHQSIFKCKSCGFSHNADLNAAKNICLKYLDATCYPNTADVNQPNSNLITNAPYSG